MKQLGSRVPGNRSLVASLFLRVDEIHAAGERDARHPAGRGREGGKRRWKILDVTPRLYVVDVGRRELVVQALHELIVHGLGDVLHRAWLSGKFEVTPQLVERGLRAQGPAVAAALAADPRTLAAAGLALRPWQGDGVQAEGRGLLPCRPGAEPRRWLGPRRGIAVRVDSDHLAPLALALAHSEVLLHPRLLHAVQGLDVHRAAAPALVAVRASARPAREEHEMARRVKAPLNG